MKTTFVFVGNRNYKKILEGFNSNINLSNYDYNIFFLINTPVDNSENLENSFPEISHKIMIFDSFSKENEMLEYFFQNEPLNNVVLIKESYQNVNFDDINSILKQANKGRDVVISKQNKQQNFFSKLWKNIKNFVVRYLFGFKMYSSEADIMFLSALAVSIIKQSPCRSAMFTKMDTWAGLDTYEALISSQPKQKSNIKISKSYLGFLIGSSTLFLAMIIGHIIFAVLNVHLPFLALLSYILVEVVLFGAITFYSLKIFFIKKFGKLNFINEAVLTQTIDNLI